MNLQRLVYQNTEKLSDLDYGILEVIHDNPKKILDLGIEDLAKKSHVSKSSVLRLTKKLGFSGFSEFKYFLRQDSINYTEKESFSLINDLSNDVTKTIEHLKSFDLTGICQVLDECDCVYCYATGFSQKKAIEEFSKQLLVWGKRALILPNKTEFDMAMPMITKKDCVLLISLGGETENVKENLTMLNVRKIPTITVTRVGDNYFSRNSNHHLDYFCTPFIANGSAKDFVSLVGLHCAMDYLFRTYCEYKQQGE